MTGNWDPTTNTILGQINVEALIFGQLIRTPMRPGQPNEILFELAAHQETIDPYTLQYSLRGGVDSHAGKAF